MVFTVHYEKTFSSGLLAGMTVPCELRYPTFDGALNFMRWAENGEHGDCCTGSRWTCARARIDTDHLTEWGAT